MFKESATFSWNAVAVLKATHKKQTSNYKKDSK